VLNSGSAVVMPWLDDVKGVLEAWYPGQEDGNAIAHVLFGDVNPSGKLPVTFPASQAEMPTSRPDRWPGVAGQVQYSEGLDVGYRWYDDHHAGPAFAFGFGLSYTSFAFKHLAVHPALSRDGSATVQVDVTNTGSRAGADVVQLYVTPPRGSGEPPRQLQGFQRVVLQPGQTKRVTLALDRRALSFWDTRLRQWKALKGGYGVSVGDSSRHLPLVGRFILSKTLVWGTPTPPPPAKPPASPATAVGDVTTCWQDQLGTLANGGLSLTGGSAPANPSQVPIG
jgi:beta-glucosidase